MHPIKIKPNTAHDKLQSDREKLAVKINTSRTTKPGLMKGRGGC